MKRKKRSRARRIIGSIVLTVLVTAAIRDQLSRPPESRTWQGRVFGIPYDFRFPTLERIRNTFWNENTSQVLVPQAFGIGWTINFYPLLHPNASPRLQ